MQKIWKLMAIFAVLFILPSAPAAAQATRTWVSGVGDDVNPCSRTAPCKTFAGAISKTAGGGEINCLDPGGFGTVTITKSITLDCTGTFGSILASSTNGINVNDSATGTPGTIKVVIRGLSIDGAGTTLGLNGVNITSGREVTVLNTYISNFSNTGINVNAPTTQIALNVENSAIYNTNRGINVSSASGNGNARVYNTFIAGGAASGITVSGAGNKAEISDDVIIRTAKSLDIVSGGAISSYGDNVLSAGDAPTIVPKG